MLKYHTMYRKVGVRWYTLGILKINKHWNKAPAPPHSVIVIQHVILGEKLRLVKDIRQLKWAD